MTGLSAPGSQASSPIATGAGPAPQAYSLRVKICGITREQDARAALSAGADCLGLVFAPSPRRVDAGLARRLAAAVRHARWVGVFARATTREILSAAAAVPLAAVQLHGDERQEQVAELHDAGLEVWRVVGVGEPAEWAEVEARVTELAGVAHTVLLDRRDAERAGGIGTAFDWAGMPGSVRELLRGGLFGVSGGLRPENVAEAVARLDPDIVDASSGLETSPGVKDPVRVRGFVGAARRAHAALRPAAGGA